MTLGGDEHTVGRVSRLRSFAIAVAFAAPIGLACGASSALFLFCLERVTETRLANEWLVYLLPVAGALIGLAWQRFGKPIKRGSNLVIDTSHSSGAPRLPTRLAPMVLIGTLLTHLFGGSAGREGTAVQIGATLADLVASRFSPSTRRMMLMAGVAGGFGSVFGTPWAGAVFAMEFVVFGRAEVEAFVPALISAMVGDLTTRSLGIAHTPYPTVAPVAVTLTLLGKWLIVAVAVALVTAVFITSTEWLKHRLEALPQAARMALGGVVVVALWKLVGTSDYLGLGVPGIVRAFSQPLSFAFAWKLLFTVVTIGTGFIGGEVTPLFFVGATLGSELGAQLGIPIPLAAGVGLAAVFGAASKAPLALSVMAVELLGIGVLPHVLLVCVVASLLTGRRTIYPAQFGR